ncbi:MAG: ADP-ribosylglycohydrolase family protein [Lachnospiraceae bacterium]|jgi:ADP-ribosylglycohydrolase|nr:ADP-ribosylglycohydrolase family protein [Lachnospiraceae bacterium]
MRANFRSALIGYVFGEAAGGYYLKRKDFSKYKDGSLLRYGFFNRCDDYLSLIGVWGNNTSMVWATINSISKTILIDYEHIMENFIYFYKQGGFTAFRRSFELDRVTRNALENRLKTDCTAIEAGSGNEEDNTNTSLSRIFPIVYYALGHKTKNDEIYKLVEDLSSLTHRNQISIFACFIYVMYFKFLIETSDKFVAYEKLKKYIKENYKYNKVFSRIIDKDIFKYEESSIKSTENVVDTLEATLWCFLNADSLEHSIARGIYLGNSTIITVLVGALAGQLYGIKQITKEKNKLVLLQDVLHGEECFTHICNTNATSLILYGDLNWDLHLYTIFSKVKFLYLLNGYRKDNRIKAYSAIKEFKNIEELKVDINHQSKINSLKQGIQELKKLKRLELDFGFEYIDISCLKDVKQIESISIHCDGSEMPNGKPFDLSMIKDFTNLKHLTIMSFKCINFQELLNLKNLVHLELITQNITKKEEECLKKHLPNLKTYG